MVLFPEGLKALKKVAKEVGLDLNGAYLNLDGGFDSAHNRKCIFNAGLVPNIKENPRNRKTTKRGRKRLFNAAIHALRLRVERTFAWEDKFKRLLLVMACKQDSMDLQTWTVVDQRFVRIRQPAGQHSVQMGHHSDANGLQTCSWASTPCE
jgi:hypothetical protein